MSCCLSSRTHLREEKHRSTSHDVARTAKTHRAMPDNRGNRGEPVVSPIFEGLNWCRYSFFTCLESH